MLTLSSLMFGSEHPEKLAEFYEKVLEKKPDFSEGSWFGFSVGSSMLTMGSHDKVKGKSKNPERIILNFETTEVESEFERIKELGATVIAEPYGIEEAAGSKIATFADPDGNYFQLMTPWED